MKKFCKSTTDVVCLIEKLFNDVIAKKDLDNFRVKKEIRKGFGKALTDAVILEPNLAGMGFSFNKMIEYFKTR